MLDELEQGIDDKHEVVVIEGPMFSGKTTELLTRYRYAVEEGEDAILVKAATDDRYAEQQIMTHAAPNGHRQVEEATFIVTRLD